MLCREAGLLPAAGGAHGQAGRAGDPGQPGRAYKAGVKIAFGTDAGMFPHGQNAREFQYMVQDGIPPMFALQAATTHAAELLHKSDELGQVAVGRGADVIAVPGNPLEDISVMQKVSFVMKGGVVYKLDGKPAI